MKRRIILITLGVGACAWLAWHFRAVLSAGWTLASDQQALTALMQSYGGGGEAVAFVLLVSQVFLAVVPGQALMIVNGYIFSFWKGLAITWFSLVLASQVAFWLARRLGRPFAVRFVAPDTLRRWDSLSFNQSILFYVVTMLLPLFPNDGMCYVAGLSPIPARKFLVANMLARLIASLALVYLGAFGHTLPAWAWVVIAAGAAIFAALGWFMRKRLWAGEETAP